MPFLPIFLAAIGGGGAVGIFDRILHGMQERERERQRALRRRKIIMYCMKTAAPIIVIAMICCWQYWPALSSRIGIGTPQRQEKPQGKAQHHSSNKQKFTDPTIGAKAHRGNSGLHTSEEPVVVHPPTPHSMQEKDNKHEAAKDTRICDAEPVVVQSPTPHSKQEKDNKHEAAKDTRICDAEPVVVHPSHLPSKQEKDNKHEAAEDTHVCDAQPGVAEQTPPYSLVEVSILLGGVLPVVCWFMVWMCPSVQPRADPTLDILHRMSDISVADCMEDAPMFQGLSEQELLPLVESVAPLAPLCLHVVYMAGISRERAVQRLEATELRGTAYATLTAEEAGAIHLFTSEWEPVPLYRYVNEALRCSHNATERQRKLGPLMPYMKLLLTALRKLPPAEDQPILFRGVTEMDFGDRYEAYEKANKPVSWWEFSSTTCTMAVLQNPMFLGQVGPRTVFMIEGCTSGRDVRPFSAVQAEDEVLLWPATMFTVKEVARDAWAPGLTQIRLEMVDDGKSVQGPW